MTAVVRVVRTRRRRWEAPGTITVVVRTPTEPVEAAATMAVVVPTPAEPMENKLETFGPGTVVGTPGGAFGRSAWRSWVAIWRRES